MTRKSGSGQRLALLIATLWLTAMGCESWAQEIPLWPDGAVPLPPSAAGAEQPGPEKIEDRNSEGPANRRVTGTTRPTLTAHSPPAADRSGAAQ